MKTGLVIYPQDGLSSRDAIAVAFPRSATSTRLTLTAWDDVAADDELVVASICQAIDQVDLVCADLTALDPKVLLALGYAIGLGKATWVFADAADPFAGPALERFASLLSSTPRTYVTGYDVARWFLYDMPEFLGGHWRPVEALRQLPEATQDADVLWLHERPQTPGLQRLNWSLSTLAVSTQLGNRAMIAAHPLSWALPHLFSAPASIFQFLAPLTNDAHRLLNAETALIAGIAHALRRPVLILDEVDHLRGADCRGVAHIYDGSSARLHVVDDWHDEFAAPTDYPVEGFPPRLVHADLYFADCEVLVRRILAELSAWRVTDNCIFSIKLALWESLTNAYRHGNKGREELPIHVSYALQPGRFDLEVHDEGESFCFEELLDPTRPENLMRTSGRGVYLIRHVMDEVEAIGGGDGIRMRKYLSTRRH